MPEIFALLQTRLKDLRQEMARRGLAALIVPRFDAHQGEYIAPHDERLRYVTGFTGSAGMAIVTENAAVLFVDGRYTVQAHKECPGDLFGHRHFLQEPPDQWLRDNIDPGAVVGFDPMLLPPTWFRRYDIAARAAGARLQAVGDNSVDAIWEDQPPPPMGSITAYPERFAGASAGDKREALVAYMTGRGVDLFVETQPDNIAWLLNVRGADVALYPIPHSFLVATTDSCLHWFVDQEKFTPGLADALPQGTMVRPMKSFLPELCGMSTARSRVLIDPDFSPTAAVLVLEETESSVIEECSHLTLTKAGKNECELDGLRSCHLADGMAWTEFCAWLHQTVPERVASGNPVTELEAEQKVQALRAAQRGYIDESFRAISAAAGNAAMNHYAAADDHNAPILPEAPYLLDSGGQYETGTTDATRCFSFSASRPDGYDRAYTAVFRAFHALATLRFPPGTQGHHIDAICRRPLWDLGLDYDHGTGHGIGHRLSVHEQPQRIGKLYNPVDLRPGMVLSIEPGFYVTGSFGVRIENLFEIVAAEDGFLEFKNMTWIPIQTDMLLPNMLTVQEMRWLNAYHADISRKLSVQLSPDAQDWLKTACAPLSVSVC